MKFIKQIFTVVVGKTEAHLIKVCLVLFTIIFEFIKNPPLKTINIDFPG